ncbi:MAG: CC/Se motif family (seleno)protein [Tissierellia bacterium]|nr:CC/Se motif family (seleno)protein [Tissierellia bacterium]
MKVTIEPKAMEYLKKKNIEEFTLSQYVPKMCCGSGMPDVVTYIGKPKAEGHEYDTVDVEGYRIYIDPYLELEDKTVTISMEKYLMMSNLKASIM